MPDKWSDWLLKNRFGGDAKALEAGMRMLTAVRDVVLDGARLKAGEVVLDVGAGDGLIAFSALERVGPQGAVIFSDVSQPLLDHARDIARESDVLDQCRFVNADAERLDGIDDASVDAVTARSVLIYVSDKEAAFRSMHRVLRSNGRVSIWEPINRFGAESPPGILGVAADAGPDVSALAQRLHDYYRALQPLDTDPMLNFGERDLFRMCVDAGFVSVTLKLTLTAKPSSPIPWDVAIRAAGNPNIPPVGEAMRALFTTAEQEAFTTAVRPLVEAGGHMTRSAVAHLTATKRT